MTPPLIGCLPTVNQALVPQTTPVESLETAANAGVAFVLGHHQGALAIWQVGSRSTPLYVDFIGGRLGYRLAAGRARQETLVRAVLGRYSPSDTRVLDATAGLGRDAALIAAAGCEVVLLERQPLLAALLADGLARAGCLPFCDRMTLQARDACDYMQTLGLDAVDVIYLDPMFTPSGGRANVKKELAWLKQLLGPATALEEQQLLELARSRAKRRVVVKRAAKAPPLAQVPPTASLAGKAVRFDIYTPL